MNCVSSVETLAHRRGSRRLDSVDANLGIHLLDCDGHSRDQTAAADSDHDDVEIVDLLDQFETGRSRPGTNQLVVEWMDVGQAAIALELARAPKRLDARCAVQHDFGFI